MTSKVERRVGRCEVGTEIAECMERGVVIVRPVVVDGLELFRVSNRLGYCHCTREAQALKLAAALAGGYLAGALTEVR